MYLEIVRLIVLGNYPKRITRDALYSNFQITLVTGEFQMTNRRSEEMEGIRLVFALREANERYTYRGRSSILKLIGDCGSKTNPVYQGVSNWQANKPG